MIYSVDFDGTLCSNRFPEIGEPNLNLIQFLINQRHMGNIVILNTMREGETLDDAVNWCRKYDLEFDAVNDNAEVMKEFYKNNPRKIFANVYIDDRNAKYGVCVDLPFKEREGQ